MDWNQNVPIKQLTEQVALQTRFTRNHFIEALLSLKAGDIIIANGPLTRQDTMIGLKTLTNNVFPIRKLPTEREITD